MGSFINTEWGKPFYDSKFRAHKRKDVTNSTTYINYIYKTWLCSTNNIRSQRTVKVKKKKKDSESISRSEHRKKLNSGRTYRNWEKSNNFAEKYVKNKNRQFIEKEI